MLVLGVGFPRVALFLGGTSPEVERFDGSGVVRDSGEAGEVSQPGNRFGPRAWAIADNAEPEGLGTTVQQIGRGCHDHLVVGSRFTPVLTGCDRVITVGLPSPIRLPGEMSDVKLLAVRI